MSEGPPSAAKELHGFDVSEGSGVKEIGCNNIEGRPFGPVSRAMNWAFVTIRSRSLWPGLVSHWGADGVILVLMWFYFIR
jgi:hypothetical protein